MPSARSIEAGRAVLRIVAVDGGVRETLNQIEGVLESYAGRIRNVGLALTATGAAGLLSLVAPLREAAKAEQVAAKFGAVFGQSADSVRAWAAQLSDALGRSNTAIQATAANFQDLLQPAGIASEPAWALSQQLTELAFDLEAFSGVDYGTAVRDLQAALTGSSETMQKYGVIVNEAAVQQELFRQNLDPRTVSDAEKIQARFNIIMAKTSAAQGAAARSGATLVGTMTKLTDSIRETSAAFGRGLIPVVQPIVSSMASLVRVVGQALNAFPQISTLFGALAVAGTAAGVAISTLGAGLGLLLSPITLVSIALKALNIDLAAYATRANIAAAATLSWKVATDLLGTSVRLLLGALAAIARNPVFLAITAAVAATTALGAAFSISRS